MIAVRGLILALVVCGCASARAATSPPVRETAPGNQRATQEAIRAATQRAVCDLYDQISVLQLNSGTTVGQFVKTLEAEQDLMKILSRADQIGSPRWIDAATCQVQLEVSASRVSYVLRQLAAAYPKSAPATVADIDRALERWGKRSFVSTGSSSSLPSLAQYKPLGARWAAVSDEARRKALADANLAARQRTLDSVKPVVLIDTTTVAHGLAEPRVGEVVNGWLAERPVTKVDFRDDLTVEVSLAVDHNDFFDVVKTALLRQNVVRCPRDERSWQRIAKDFLARFVPAVGQATAVAGVLVPDGAFIAPGTAPEWAEQTIEVRGVGRAENKLRAALSAENDARTLLRGRLEALEIEPRRRLGALAPKHAVIASALDRAVESARITRTEYNADGSANVILWLDLRTLWDDLKR